MAVGMALGISSMYALSCGGTKPAGETEPCTQESGCSYGRVCDLVKGYCVNPGGEGDDTTPLPELIAFILEDDVTDGDLYVMGTDGSNPRSLTALRDGAEAEDIEWSVDGRKIAFVSDATGSKQVYTINRDGSELQQLTTSGHNTQLQWSPDGRYIALSGNGPDEILRIKVADGTYTNLTNTTDRSERKAAWSP